MMEVIRWREPICCARPGSVTSTASALMRAESSACSSDALPASSACSTATRTSLTALPTAARSSLGTCPMLRRYPVSVPFLPSTPTRTCSSADVSPAAAIAARVSSLSWESSSTNAMSRLPSSCDEACPPQRRTDARRSRAPVRPIKKSLSRLRARTNPESKDERGSRGTTLVDARRRERRAHPLVCPMTGAPVAAYLTSARSARPRPAFSRAARKGIDAGRRRKPSSRGASSLVSRRMASLSSSMHVLAQV